VAAVATTMTQCTITTTTAATAAVGVNTTTIPAEFPLPDHITCSGIQL
jgi:hypothetical protein